MLKENDNQLFSKELIDIINSKKDEKHLNMIQCIDGEPKNVNPLKEIPQSQMKLYGFSGIYKNIFFDTESELLEYVKNNKLGYGNVCIMDFLGNVAGCNDVIRLTYIDGNEELYTAVNEEGYGKYNSKRSFYKGEFVWEFNHGSIREMYSAFRDRGIVFENDVYAKIDEGYKRVMQMCEKEPTLTRKK